MIYAEFDPDYRDAAECKGMDPNDFFPERITKANSAKIQVLIDMCLSCPVQAHCLYDAVVNEYYGIWGGMTEKERFAWIKDMKKNDGEITFDHCEDFFEVNTNHHRSTILEE